MGRPAKPWYWEERNGWYAVVRGRRRKLAKGHDGRAAAYQELGRLLGLSDDAEDPGPGPDARDSVPDVSSVAGLFLDEVHATLAESTYVFYRENLARACRGFGSVPFDELTPATVLEWLATHDWATNTRRAAIACLKRLSRWAAQAGHCSDDRLSGLPKPAPETKAAIPAAGDVETLREAIACPRFRDLVTAIWETGCRSSEAYRVEAADVDLTAGTWTLKGKSTWRTGRARVIHIESRTLEITRRLCAENPSGPIFRNAKGRPWTRAAGGEHTRRLRKRLGLGPEVTLAGLRHLYVTDALEGGIPIATVSELVGHSDTTMVSRVYSRLGERSEHLKTAARKVRGEGK